MTGVWLVAFIALWVLFLVVALVLLIVLRNFGELYNTLSKLQQNEPDPIKLASGEALPDLPLQTLDGQPATLAGLRGTPTAFSVISPSCGPCRDLLLTVAAGRDDADALQPATRRVLISLADAEATARVLRETGFPADVAVLLSTYDALQAVWGVVHTPITVIADADLRFVRHNVGFTAPTFQHEPAIPVLP